ncbi:MAG: aldo/keto reductase [Candidatus Kapabacteria bacterium]|nr:aldo/keto reductase [Candidatus Kapabacteria bacterium]
MSTSEEYAQRFPALRFVQWTTGETASSAGFGCYRINTHNPDHANALAAALRSGINVVDTAANYGDGSAEELLGKALADATKDGIPRSQLILISKAGYMQGRNYHRAYKKEHQGHAFPHVVKYADGLWHCIHPEFLEDQLTRSLRHINTEYLDVHLLHNPEYFLMNAAQEGIPVGEAREEFYDRIRLAFAHLESEVQTGRIRHYGISSNCFARPSYAADAVSLEECIRIAEDVAGEGHHFRTIQLPFNLLETGAATERNQRGDSASVLETAAANGINVIVNRVLNAITNNSLLRLAEHAYAGTEPPSESDIAALIGDLVAHESVMLRQILPALPYDTQSREELESCLSPGTHLVHHWNTFESIEHWHDVETQYLRPRMNEAIEAIMHHPVQGMEEWIQEFKHKAAAAFKAITHHYAVDAHPRLEAIRSKAVDLLGESFSGMTISQLAFNAPRATDGVTCTLIGARRERYVSEIIELLGTDTPSLSHEDWMRLMEIGELV